MVGDFPSQGGVVPDATRIRPDASHPVIDVLSELTIILVNGEASSVHVVVRT